MVSFFEIILISICAFAVLNYIVIIVGYCYGWLKLTNNKNQTSLEWPMVSVIVAARNEENVILNCLQALSKQKYKSTYEIIIVNDFSEDDTANVVKKFMENSSNKNIKLLISDLPGKKNAIEKAIKESQGEIIVTTDADCIMGEKWLETIVESLITSENQMVVGPVNHYNEKNILQKFQTLELISLITSGGASLYYNKAIMSNGANQAYYKKAFCDVGGYEGLKGIASGDDVLLMYKIKNKFGNKISFVKNKNAFVYTQAKSTLKEFLNQRVRWASKGFLMLNKDAKQIAFIVVAANVLLSICMLYSLCYLVGLDVSIIFLKLFGLLLFIKWFIDFLLLFLSAKFFSKTNYLIYFLPHQLFYSIYIFIVAVLSNTGKYEWKGRKVK